MRIAICDDDNRQIDMYESYFEKIMECGFSIDYDAFSSGEALLKRCKTLDLSYDLLFLDMQMDKMDGIETAKQLREMDKKILIVFVTSYEDYVYESFQVRPFRYLVKPLRYEKFLGVFHAAYEEIEQQGKSYYVKMNGSEIRLNYEDILYFESDRRKVCVHTRNRNYEFYSKLTKIQEELGESDFIHIHQSYLVNMNHIRGFHQNRIELNDGTMLPVSENRRKEAREAYARFSTRKYHAGGGESL